MTDNITVTGRTMQLIRNEIIEECAKAVEKAWPLGDYPLASENTDSYRAQDAAVRTVLKVIRRMAVLPTPQESSEAKS